MRTRQTLGYFRLIRRHGKIVLFGTFQGNHPKQRVSLAMNPPARECIIEYLGKNSFLVLHSTNAKLQTGDLFTASQFILGQPLTATDVITIRQNSPQLTTYVAGAQK